MRGAGPFVVGLTGGIGSGKSAVAERWGALGAAIVDTDVIAHRLTSAGGEAISPIAAAFGPEVVTSEGALDRAAMRARAFADPAARQRLESILHPLIRQVCEDEAVRAVAPYVVLVVPLLVESGAYRDRCARVCVVDCPESEQIARVKRRSGLDETTVRAIMAAQASRAERLAVADDVVDNSRDLAFLIAQADALHQRYLALAGVLPLPPVRTAG